MPDRVVSTATNVTVCGARLVLTVATTMLGRVDLGAWNLPIALAIAALKGSLVVRYFMHVRFGAGVVRLAVADRRQVARRRGRRHRRPRSCTRSRHPCEPARGGVRMDGISGIERAAEQAMGGRPDVSEDRMTETVERYTAAIPSSGYLGVAVGAMALSLGLQLAGRRQLANFIATWVPTWLIIGVYNKLVKLEGHDRQDRGSGGQRRDQRSAAVGISNRPLAEEQQRQESLPPRGSATIG